MGIPQVDAVPLHADKSRRRGIWHHPGLFCPVSSHSGASAALPWAPWNLRVNPFGEPPPESLPEMVVADVRSMAAFASEPRCALQLLGEKGRGKTAHLNALRSHFPAAPYVYLGEGEPIPAMPSRGSLLLDEAQRLPRRRRRRLFAGLRHLVLSSHEDLETEMGRAGWTVRSVHVGGLDLPRLEAVVARRFEWARRGPGPLPELDREACRSLLRRHGDDLRAILDELYERLQAAVDRRHSTLIDSNATHPTPNHPNGELPWRLVT